MDELLDEIYGKQKILPQDQFLFGRIIGDFFEIARHTIPPQQKSLTRTTYPKIWVYILRYVCALWRVRSDLVNRSEMSSEKAKSLAMVESLLDSSDIGFLIAGDKSLLTKKPHSGWKIEYINDWIRTIQTSIARGKRTVFKNQQVITTFLTK